MKPGTGGAFMSTDRSIGIIQIEKPHNEKPVGRFDLKKLKEMVYVAEKLGHEEAWVWYKRIESSPGQSGLVVITSERDASVGVGVAGKTEHKE